MTWNGTTITGPVLIYQDEIISNNRALTDPPLDGTLICSHETQAQVGWHFADAQALSTNPNFNFRQRRTGTTATPSVSRLTTNQEDQPLENAIANGLWTCRLDADFNSAFPVGIYVRGKVITIDFSSGYNINYKVFMKLLATSNDVLYKV